MQFLHHGYNHNIMAMECPEVFSYEVAFPDMWGRQFLRYTATSYFSNVVYV